MKRFIRTAALLLIVAFAGVAQEPTKYIMLGTHKGISFEIELAPKEVARTRNTIISGEAKGYYIVKQWSYDCPSRSIKELHRSLYNPDDVLVKDEKGEGAWLQTEKGSYGRQALDEFWCKDSY